MASIDRVMALAEELKKKKKNTNYEVNQSLVSTLDLANDIRSGNTDALKNYIESDRGMFDAPIRSAVKNERKWFEKGAFEDGYDFGDITKTVVGSSADLVKNAAKGALNIGESAIDAGAYIAGGVGKIFGGDKFADKMERFIEKDLINEDKIANRIANTGTPIGWVNNLLNGEFSSLNPFGDETTESIATDKTSVFGDKSDSLAQSAGQLGATIGLQAVGVPWWITTGVTSFGGEVESALKQDATYGEAGFSGLVNAGAEVLTEKLSGGISFGGKTLDAGLKSQLTKGITNKTLNTLAQFGIDVVGEGTEELLTEVISNVGKKLSYEDEKTWGEILASEEAMDSYLEAFIGGAVLGGGFNVGRVSSSIQSGRNYDTGLTTNEQSIVDKEVQSRVSELEQEGTKLTNKQKTEIEKQVRNDLEKGYISTDTIESTLGGETYNTLKSTRDTKTDLENKIAELENKSYAELTVKEMEQLQAYREQLSKVDTNTLENNLRSEMGQKIKSDTYLQRSYQEKANRSVQFEADLSKYDAKQQAVVQKAIDSGILNNTNRTHDFVDMVAKISADKGIDFDFTNNTKLKESGFAVEGKTVNGYIKDGSIAVNIDSSKALNRVVGHEITHVLEGTELYTELQNAVKQYAATKGEYDSRLADLTKLYKDVKDANIENELTADLVGDYLFTDTDFINNLSVEKPSLFKKVYNEIKHLYNMATAGSKEARELLKVKKAFEKAYRENIVQKDTRVRDSLSEIQGLESHTTNEIKQITKDYINEKIIENDLTDVEIKDIAIHGSRNRGNARPDSDLDVVVEYEGDIREDDFFSILNEEPLFIEDIRVDINPIKESLSDYMIRSEAYDKKVLSNSKKKDNLGRELTTEQTDFFKDSKVVDADGNLLVMYHGTRADFNTFDMNKSGQNYEGDWSAFGRGFYFTPNQEAANEFSSAAIEGDSKSVKEVYLNITKPFYTETNYSETLSNLKEKYNIDDTTLNKGYRLIEFLNQNGYDSTKVLQELGYDGVIDSYNGKVEEAVAFKGNQIKNTDNTKPTLSEDIRYSLSSETDNKGRELTNAQVEHFKDSKARDDEGRLLEVYHGTNEDFTIFDKSYIGSASGDLGFLGDGFYFATHKGEADYYGNTTKAVYLNITNPYNIKNLHYHNGISVRGENSNPYLEIKNLVDMNPEWGKIKLKYNNTYGDVAREVTNLIDNIKVEEAGRTADGYKQFKTEVNGKIDFVSTLDNYTSNEVLGDTLNKEMRTVFGYIPSSEVLQNITSEAQIRKLNNQEPIKTFSEVLQEQGYDGIFQGDTASYTDEIVVFNPNQIKSVDNLNPTNDPDIRYSLSEEAMSQEMQDVVFDDKFYETYKYEDKTPITESIEELKQQKTEIDEHYTDEDYDRRYKINAKIKALEKGYNSEYDYYIGEAKRRIFEEYKYNPEKFDKLVEEKNIAKNKDIQLQNEIKEATPLKREQYYIIQETNPAPEGSNYVWVRSPKDIKTFDEVVNDEESFSWGDYSQEDALNDLKRNRVVIYSSYPIKQGVFVSTSKIQAQEYAGGEGSFVYSKQVSPDSVAWINGDEGQYAKVPQSKLSLSNPNEQIAPSRNDVFGRDIRLEIAPLQEEIQALTETVTELKDVIDMGRTTTIEDLPMLEQQNSEAFNTLTDEDYAPVIEDTMPETEGTTTIESPLETEGRDIDSVGNRKVKAYQYENPEVRPYFQAEARVMLGDLKNSVRGERNFNDQVYYDTAGEQGFYGTTRQTTDDIAYLKDSFGYSYAEIEKGLNAIIEDRGAENIAVAKRIEFMLDERLREGYTSIDGTHIPANQEYINLLQGMEQAKQYSEAPLGEAPYVEEASNTNIAEDIAPIRKVFNEKVRESAKQIEKELGYLPKDPTKESSYDEVAEILTEEPKTQNDRNKRKAAIIAANVLDKGLVFENVSLKHKNRELMGKWDYTLTSEARAQTAIGQGHYDNETGRTISKSLNEIMEEVNNTGLTKQFYEYIYHKHNVDRMQLADKFEGMKNKPVFGEHITAEASQEIVNQYEFSNPEFMDFAKDVYEYVNADRKVLVDNGVISQETADLWSKMYPHYVPIRRAGHNGNAINVPLDTGRTGINAPIKKATGGSSDILPLFDTMASRTLQTYRAAAKNSFGVELKNTIGTTINSQATTVDEVIDSVDAQESLLQEGKAGQKPTFTVFENGEKITFEITEDMYDALKPLSDSSILSKTIKPLNIASSFHRGLLTQYNPVFAITNGIKDIQDVLINSQHVAKTYSKIPEAYAQVFKKGYWYQEYMANGGEHNSYFDSQDNTFKTENKGLYKLLDTAPLKQIAQLNDFIEIVPRLSEYIASREMGRSIEVSMLDAARVTTNFKAGGNLTKFLNRNGATFLNASVQGAMQQVRNIREAKANGIKGWANLATKFAIAGLPVFLLNALLWDDDEEYEELSDYVKQNYYVVAKTDDGKFIRIPKGRALAVIQDAIKQMKNLVTGDDEVDLASFIDLVITNIAPSNPIESNIFAPIIQVANNETWYGEDLVPTRLQDLPAAEQYDESTDSFSKWLGGVLDISPYKINYLLDQYSGGVGDVILPTLTPEAESGDDSFFGNMIAPLKSKFTTDAVMNNQNVSDFYSKSEELTTNAKKSNATDEDVLKNKYINSVKAEMNELYAQKREIQNSNLPSNEKYNRVREIQGQINELSKNALNSYEDVDIQSDYATAGDREYKVNSDGEWQKINDKQLEKQNAVIDMFGVSPNEYWRNKEEYDYAYENPNKYKVIEQIDTFEKYNSYKDDIADIKEQYKGYSTEQRKAAVQQYIESLNLTVPQKIMLEKMAGGYSIKSYRSYMQSYIESLPLTAEEKQAIDDELFK